MTAAPVKPSSLFGGSPTASVPDTVQLRIVKPWRLLPSGLSELGVPVHAAAQDAHVFTSTPPSRHKQFVCKAAWKDSLTTGP